MNNPFVDNPYGMAGQTMGGSTGGIAVAPNLEAAQRNLQATAPADPSPALP